MASKSKAKAKSNGIGLDRKIEVLAETNPKRKGAATYKTFALYKTGQTVKQFLDAGGTLAHVKFDLEHKHIALK